MCQSGSLGPAEYVALWIHTEERIAGIKNQMIATLTLLHGFLVPLVAVVFVRRFDSSAEVPSGSIVLVASLVGLVLSVLSLYVFLEFDQHRNSNYLRARWFKEQCTPFKEVLDELKRGTCQLQEEDRKISSSTLENLFKLGPWPEIVVFLGSLLWPLWPYAKNFVSQLG